MARRHWGIAIVLALGLLLGAQDRVHAGLITGSVSLDTSVLSGPFEIAFVFNDGSGTGDANNSVTLTNFMFGAGGSAGSVDTGLSMGGQSGDLGSSVVLVDSSFSNIFVSSFTAGSALSFDFALTTNLDAGGTPDQFSMVLLQGGTPVNTQDPTGVNSLLTVNVDSANPAFSTFASDLTPAPAVQFTTSLPEPKVLLLLSLAFVIALPFLRAGISPSVAGC